MFLLSVLACSSVNEDNFIEKYSEAACSFYEECTRSDFLEEWDDVDECVEDYLDLFEDYVDYGGCDFDKDKAKECLEDLKDATKDCDIDDLYDSDDCEEVYDCGDGDDDDGDDTGWRWDTGRRSANNGLNMSPRGGVPRPDVQVRDHLMWIAAAHDASWARVDWLDDDGRHGSVDAIPTTFAARGPAYTELEGAPQWLPTRAPATYAVRIYGVTGELVQCLAQGPAREQLVYDDSYAIADGHELLSCD